MKKQFETPLMDRIPFKYHVSTAIKVDACLYYSFYQVHDNKKKNMTKKTDSGSVLMTLRKSPQLNPLPLIRIRFCCNPLMIPQSLLSRVQRWKWTQWQAQWQAQCPQEHTCTQIPTTAINLQPCNSSAFLFQSSKTMVHGFRGLNMSFFFPFPNALFSKKT